MKNFFLCSILLIFLNACVSSVEKHGYMFDFSDYQMLQEGVTTKEKTLKIIGSPSLISDLDGSEVWIYYSEDLKHFLFFKPKVVSREVFLVKFDQENIINNLQKLSLSDEEKRIDFASKYTAVQSHEAPGFFKSLFGNVGQIKPQ